MALSRTTTLEGLHLLDFDESKIMAHEGVAEFYARLGVSCSRQYSGLGVLKNVSRSLCTS